MTSVFERGIRHRPHPIRGRVGLLGLLLLLSLAACGGNGSAPVAGPMPGVVGRHEAEIWLATTGRVRLRYWPAQRPAEVVETASRLLTGPGLVPTRFRLTGLEAGERYAGIVLRAGRQVASFRFRCAPEVDDEVDLCVATGSCAFLNDPLSDGGNAYGGDPRIFRAMAAARPDLMFWLGDNVYYRDSDLGDEALMRRRQMRPRLQPDIRAFLRGTANIAIWDDHDYGPNDSDGGYADKELALAIFDDYWCNPPREPAELPGVHFRHRVGDVEFFATDGRYHRSPNEAVDGPEKTMLGQAQRAWLIEALASSSARFKIVAFGNQVLNPICRFEGMGRYAHEREALLAACADRGVTGLVFLSGDRHHSEIIVRDGPLPYRLLDITVSPLLSGTHGSGERDNPARLEGSYITDQRNFALLHFEGRGSDRRLRIEFLDPDGRRLFQTTIPAAALR